MFVINEHIFLLKNEAKTSLINELISFDHLFSDLSFDLFLDI